MPLSDEQKMTLDLCLPPEVWDENLEDELSINLIRLTYFWGYHRGMKDGLAGQSWKLVEELTGSVLDPL